ncbi:MAG: hypothetical protein OER86_11800 [Phycisphaerae bacterium]|nr:hypothetical protein [Phycisphaerae bacterium]
MSEEQAQEQAVEPAKGKSSMMKAIVVLVVVLLLEGGTITATMYLAGGPREAQGQSVEDEQEAALNKPSELLVVKDRYSNTRSGRQFLYDTEIYITVRTRHRESVEAQLKDQQAQIAMEIGTIMRSSVPAVFEEPTLGSLRRKIKAMLDERLGTDAEGESIAQQVVMTKCTPIPVNF